MTKIFAFTLHFSYSSKMKTFTQEMRIATRDVHDLSDKLVNFKLMFGMIKS